MAAAQGLDHLPNPRQRGWHSLQTRAVARGFHHLGQSGLAGGSVQHGQGSVLGRKTTRQGLGGDFKTTQMGREEKHPFATGISLGHHRVALPTHRRWRPQPQARQFGRHCPRMADGRRHLGESESGLTGVVHETPPVHR